MTEEKIIEGNTLIAEFMGYTVYRKRYPRNHGIGAPEAEWKDIVIEKAKFHKSWDAIMPVWQKFRDLPFENTALKYSFREFSDGISNAIYWHEVADVWSNLCEAINWYKKIENAGK